MNTFLLLALVFIAVAICFAVIGFTALNVLMYTSIPFFVSGLIFFVVGVKKGVSTPE
jgi:hypothetical protein